MSNNYSFKMTIEREQARQTVLRSKLLRGGEILHESTDLIPSNHPLGRSISSPAESWFFLIDDFPAADWGHQCRYVFVDRKNGSITVVNETSPPMDVNLKEVISS